MFMFEMTDILARLQNGESAEDIAKEFTAALNAAETEIQKQDEKEQQYTEFKAIMDQTVDYIKRYYPEVEMTEMDEANYRDMFVAMDDLVGFCGDLKFGRTVHSLINALSRYNNIKIVFARFLKCCEKGIKSVLFHCRKRRNSDF